MGPIAPSVPPSTGSVGAPVSIPGTSSVGLNLLSVDGDNAPFVFLSAAVGLMGALVAVFMAQDVLENADRWQTKAKAVALAVLAASFALVAAAGGILLAAGASPALMVAGAALAASGLFLYGVCMRALHALIRPPENAWGQGGGRWAPVRMNNEHRGPPPERWQRQPQPARNEAPFPRQAPQHGVQQPHDPATLEGVRHEEGIAFFNPQRQRVREAPRQVLADLRGNLMMRARGVCAYLRVEFRGEGGADAGGLRRDFWTLLGQSIFQESSNEAFLPALRSEGGFVPDLNRLNGIVNQAERQRKRTSARADYVALGEVMCWGARKELRFPPMWAPRVFEAMKAHLNGEFNQVGLLAVHGQIGATSCYPAAARSDAQWEWLANQYYGLREDAQDYDAWAQEWLGYTLQQKKAALQQAGVMDRLIGWIQRDVQGAADAMAALVEGIGVDVGERGIAWLADQSPVQLKAFFCGELNADMLLQRVECNDGTHRRWLQNWIGRSNPVQLQKFVRAVTGASTLGPDDAIRMHVNAGTHISAHTCGRLFEMPRQPNEADFMAFLDGWVDGEGRGGERFNAI